MKSQTLKETNVTFLDPLWSYKGRIYEGILKGVSIKFPQITSLLGKFLPFNYTAFSSFTEVLPVTWRAILLNPEDQSGHQNNLTDWLFSLSFIRGVGGAVRAINPSQCPLQYVLNIHSPVGDPSLFFTHFIFSSLAAPAPAGQALWRAFSHK